jgi:dephospho-CoA kinase
MIVIGLTGSIGMGKSAVARMATSLGVPVFDADAAVHALQGPGGRLVPAIEARFPATTSPVGVDRRVLGALVLGDNIAMRALERIIHPAVAAERRAFLRRHRSRPLVMLDVPLLFETRGERAVDHIMVVSAPPFVQRRRVMARSGMTHGKLQQILARQLPDHRKRLRADSIIATARPLWETRCQLQRILTCLRARGG